MIKDFSQFHPSWDGCDFSKEEYASLMEELAKKKPQDALLADGHSLRLAGKAMQVWQKIRGFLGFDDLTDPIKVNYELLKLLRYGEAHHFLDDVHIKEIVKRLSQNLKQDQNRSFERISLVIEQILPVDDSSRTASLLNNEIKRFYSENKGCLHEAFWPRLFHKYIAPVHLDAARLHFNHALIHLEHTQFEEAIDSLEKALQITPEKPLWQFTLAETLSSYAEQKSQEESLELHKKALHILKSIPESEEISIYDLKDAQKHILNQLISIKAFSEANNWVAELMAAHPKDTGFWLLASVISDRLHDSENARHCAKTAIELEPHNLQAHIRWYELTGHFDTTYAAHAVEAAKIAAAVNPADWHLQMQLGGLYKTLGDLPTAIAHMENANKLNPKTPGLLLALGQSYHESQKYNLALDAYQQAAANENSTLPFAELLLDCHSELAKRALANGAYQQVLNHYVQMLSVAPLKASVTAERLVSIGDGLAQARPAFAEQAYKLALPHIQDEAIDQRRLIQIYYFLAEQAEKNHALVTAIGYMQSAKALDPRNSATLQKLANYYIVSGDASSAEQTLTTFANKDQGTESQSALAYLYLNEKKFEQALTAFQKLNKTSNGADNGYNEEIIECLFGLALKNEESHPSLTIAYYKQLCELASNEQKQTIALALLNLGHSLLQSQEHAGAANAFETSLKIAPHLNLLPPKLVLEACRYLALSYEESKQTRAQYLKQAIKAARMMAATSPDNWRIHMQISSLYQYLADASAALEHLEIAKQLNPANQEIISSIGLLHYGKGQYELALNAYHQAAQLAGSPLPFLEKLVACHAALANQALVSETYEEMLKHYAQLLSINPLKASETGKTLVAIGDELKLKSPAIASKAYKMALPHVKDGILDKGHLIDIYYLLASEEKKAHALQAAIGYMENAKELDPKNPKTLKKLSAIYMASGDVQASEQVLSTLVRVGDFQAESSLAHIYLAQSKYAEALDTFQKLAASKNSSEDFHEEILKCHLSLALDCEIARPAQAIAHYEKALTLASSEDQQSIAFRLLNLANSLTWSGKHDLALHCFAKALESAPQIPALPQSLVFEAYCKLARADILNKKYAGAAENFQQALRLQPNNIDLIVECAEFDYSQGFLEKSALAYRKAMTLQPDIPSHRRRLAALELALGDKYYTRGVFNPARVHKSIVNLINLATTASFAEHIQSALGFWRGKNSSLNMELTTKLAKNPQSLESIEADGRRACEILEMAYDGGRFHMNPSEMPPQLAKAIFEVRQEITGLRAYYETLQQQTEDVITNLLASPLASNFSQWTPVPKIRSLDESASVEEHTKKTLRLIQKAVQQNPTAITPAMQQQIDSLYRLSLPSGWMSVAIGHYHNVLELSPKQYGEHCNRLIDAYVQTGDFVSAIMTYEQLKQTFPTNRLHIDPNAYVQAAENPNEQSKISKQQMFDGLMRAGGHLSQEGLYDEALKAYDNALRVATSRQAQETALHLLVLGDRLLNAGTRQEAAIPYASAFPYLKDLNLPPERLAGVLVELGYAATLEQDYPKAINYYEQAITAQPGNEKTYTELGSIYLILNQPEKALPYYENAAKANPINEVYQRRLAEIEIAIGDKNYAQGSVYNLNKSLRALVAYVTSEASYADVIKSALGSGLGFMSAQNRKLRGLGSGPLSAAAVETDCLSAISLLQTVYDGKANHKQPEEIPDDLVECLTVLNNQLNSLQTSMKDIPQHYADTFELSIVNHTQQAIAYYEKAQARFPHLFKDYYNRLIDCFIQKDEAKKALALYNKLKQSFPTSRLRINPTAYLETFDACMNEKNYAEAFKLIETAIHDNPHELSFKQRKSHLFFIMGEESYAKKDLHTAVRLYTLAAKCGVDAKKDCYIQLAKIYLLAVCGQTKIDFNVAEASPVRTAISSPSFINLEALREKEYATHFQAAVTYLKKAADVDPQDAELRFQLARTVYHSIQSVNFDVEPYIKKATELEPKNIPYAYAYLKIFCQKAGTNNPLTSELLAKFKKIGGSIVGDDDRYWDESNPYGFAHEELA